MDRGYFLLLLTIPHILCDPCDDSELLADDRRSAMFVPGELDTLICDAIHVHTGFWYQFEDELGNPQGLVEGCVEINHCGTQGPIWLDGTHPTEYGINVSARVCATYIDCVTPYAGRPDGCAWFRDILITRCPDDTFRFRLETPPCNLAYCSGEAETCGNGLTWDPDTQECISQTPTLTGRPVVLPPEINDDATDYDFWLACQIPIADNLEVNKVPKIEAVFLFNGEVDESTRKQANVDDTVVLLNSVELQGHLGTTVTCEASTWWEGDSIKLDPVRSENDYYVGIQVYENVTGILGEVIPPVEISESDETPRELYLVSSIPITCTHNFRCYLDIFVRSVENQGGRAVSVSVFRIEQSDWQESMKMVYNQNHPLLLTATRDPINNGDKTFVIDFEPIGGINIWDGYDVSDLQVQYRDSGRSECWSTGDPHMKTYDGVRFAILVVDDFYYVISNTVRNFQVQVRHFLCNRRNVACICAVAVREGNTVLGVDACDYYNHPGTDFAPKMKQYSATRELGAAIYRSKAGNTFAICMGSGACVRITVHTLYMNIYIDGIVEDQGKVRGLCGNYNGDSSDDFRTPDTDTVTSCPGRVCPEYSNLWKVPPEDNLFDTDPVEVTVNYPLPKLCKCVNDEGQQIHCEPATTLNTGGANEEVDPIDIVNVPNRRKRSIHSYDDHSIKRRSAHNSQPRNLTNFL